MQGKSAQPVFIRKFIYDSFVSYFWRVKILFADKRFLPPFKYAFREYACTDGDFSGIWYNWRLNIYGRNIVSWAMEACISSVTRWKRSGSVFFLPSYLNRQRAAGSERYRLSIRYFKIKHLGDGMSETAARTCFFRIICAIILLSFETEREERQKCIFYGSGNPPYGHGRQAAIAERTGYSLFVFISWVKINSYFHWAHNRMRLPSWM